MFRKKSLVVQRKRVESLRNVMIPTAYRYKSKK